MTTFPPALNLVIRRQLGVVAVDQLDTHGITRQRRRTLVGSGLFDSLHRGVYILAAAPLTLEARCVAACLANPVLVICGTTAGKIMHLRNMVGDDIHAMALNACPELKGVVTHRTNHLEPSDIVKRPDGIRMLRPRRLAFNLADHLDDLQFESVLEQLLDRGEVTVPELFEASRVLSMRGRDGTARFARVLSKRPLLAKPKDSNHEVRLLRALAGRGVVLAPQYELTLPDGTVIHLDGGDPSRRFGVEVDHITWHGVGPGRAMTSGGTVKPTEWVGWFRVCRTRISTGDFTPLSTSLSKSITVASPPDVRPAEADLIGLAVGRQPRGGSSRFRGCVQPPCRLDRIRVADQVPVSDATIGAKARALSPGITMYE